MPYKRYITFYAQRQGCRPGWGGGWPQVRPIIKKQGRSSLLWCRSVMALGALGLKRFQLAFQRVHAILELEQFFGKRLVNFFGAL